jgi:hypothetical protein
MNGRRRPRMVSGEFEPCRASTNRPRHQRFLYITATLHIRTVHVGWGHRDPAVSAAHVVARAIDVDEGEVCRVGETWEVLGDEVVVVGGKRPLVPCGPDARSACAADGRNELGRTVV